MTYEEIITEEIIRGNKWDGISFAISKADIDYTAATIKIQIRTKADQPVLLEKTITPSAAGMELLEFTVALTAAETSLLSADCQTDIQIANGSDIKSPIQIKFKVTKNITK